MNQDNEKLKGKIEKILLEFAEFAGYGQRTDQMCEAEIVNATDELLTLYTEEIAKGKEEERKLRMYGKDIDIYPENFGGVKDIKEKAVREFVKYLIEEATATNEDTVFIKFTKASVDEYLITTDFGKEHNWVTSDDGTEQYCTHCKFISRGHPEKTCGENCECDGGFWKCHCDRPDCPICGKIKTKLSQQSSDLKETQ